MILLIRLSRFKCFFFAAQVETYMVKRAWVDSNALEGSNKWIWESEGGRMRFAGS